MQKEREDIFQRTNLPYCNARAFEWSMHIMTSLPPIWRNHNIWLLHMLINMYHINSIVECDFQIKHSCSKYICLIDHSKNETLSHLTYKIISIFHKKVFPLFAKTFNDRATIAMWFEATYGQPVTVVDLKDIPRLFNKRIFFSSVKHHVLKCWCWLHWT